MIYKPNLLIIGASGGVAIALLQKITSFRNEFGKLLLLDKSTKFLNNPYIQHSNLKYKFIEHNIDLVNNALTFSSMLQKYKVDIIVDLTDYETLPLIKICNQLQIQYINTALNSDKLTVYELFAFLESNKSVYTKSIMLLATGMNPGIVNRWVLSGIKEYGIPKNIIHFEYDTSTPKTNWIPTITWSKKEFLIESTTDPSGIMTTGSQLEILRPNGLNHLKNISAYINQIKPTTENIQAMTILHEENISLSTKFKVPSCFYYAINQKTLSYLLKNQKSIKNELQQLNNTEIPLTGSDLIGVNLEYDNYSVCYYNEWFNADCIGTNATYSQVVVGVIAAMKCLIQKQVHQGINYPEDISSQIFDQEINKRMAVSKKIIHNTSLKNNQIYKYI